MALAAASVGSVPSLKGTDHVNQTNAKCLEVYGRLRRQVMLTLRCLVYCSKSRSKAGTTYKTDV